ncbi:hypothetical protein TWF703_004325 [Orbilia oligospora]|uniref:Uncharacterized protein n=1 Tax=Orbilia oligospora TaxID=2813651 RepID=A0A7C8NS46_ORBOL|nr:hypothetical protein TWF703_004325 [Orbilia oligospora]
MPPQFPITSATYSPTEYIAPEGSYPRPQQPTVPLPSSPRSAYRDPVVALSSRLPLERTKGHVAEGIGSALGKFKRAKEKEGSKLPTLWGCIGEDGGKSPVAPRPSEESIEDDMIIVTITTSRAIEKKLVPEGTKFTYGDMVLRSYVPKDKDLGEVVEEWRKVGDVIVRKVGGREEEEEKFGYSG